MDSCLSINSDGYVVFVDYETAARRRLSGEVSYGFSGRSSIKLMKSQGRQHVVFVKDGLVGTFYINGVNAGTITSTTNVAYDSQPLVFGGDIFTHSNYFNGQIDTFLFYNGALSVGDIKKYLTTSAGKLVTT